MLALACAPRLAAQIAPFGHKTVFRYRAFENARPSWVSPLDAVGGIDHTAGAGDVLDYVRGSGFERLLHTSFDGATEYLRATSAVSTVDTAGHDSFTIQAWFRASSVTGWRTLLSNTESNRGFSLKVHDGTLRGLVRLDDNGAPLDVELTGGTVVPGQWHQAAFRVDDEDTHYDLHLLLDGVRVGSRTVAHRGGVRQSSERPMVGAEPSGGAGTGDWFLGSIYAVALQNYAVGLESFLDNATIRDGSRYFGIASYHDYLDGTEGPDHRISDAIARHPDVARLSQRAYAPFLNDDYVPQGVATDGVSRVYLTMYFSNEDGENPSGTPAIAVELDAADLSLRRVLVLRGFRNSDHVGGAAVWSRWLYVPDGADVVGFDLSSAPTTGLFVPATFANNRHDTRSLTVVHRLAGALGGPGVAFASTSTDCDGAQILWVGDFDENVRSVLRGIELRADGSFGAVRHSFTLPITKVQGVHCYQASVGHLRFYLASSYGDNPSRLTDVLYEREVADALSAVTLLTLPAGLEDLEAIGDRLYMTSESGASYYQKRASSPWRDLFPFVFAYDRVPPAPPASPVHVYRGACGQASIALDSLPVLGRSYTVRGTTPAPGAGVLWLGVADVLHQGVRLPLSLAPWFPGCAINIALDVEAFSGPVPRTALATIALPRIPALFCRQLYHQWFFADATLRASEALRVYVDR